VDESTKIEQIHIENEFVKCYTISTKINARLL